MWFDVHFSEVKKPIWLVANAVLKCNTLIDCLLPIMHKITIYQKGVYQAQCGNYRIFLSLRFYVKSKLTNLRDSKSAIFAHLEALNFDFCGFLHS